MLVPAALLVSLLRFSPYVLGFLASDSDDLPKTLAAYDDYPAELPDEAVEQLLGSRGWQGARDIEGSRLGILRHRCVILLPPPGRLIDYRVFSTPQSRRNGTAQVLAKSPHSVVGSHRRWLLGLITHEQPRWAVHPERCPARCPARWQHHPMWIVTGAYVGA